jgi:hypothetical protein
MCEVSVRRDYIYQNKNYHPYQCGAFAIYNLLAHFKTNIEIIDIIKLCTADPMIGTLIDKMNTVIKTISEITHINIISLEPNINFIDTVLNNNGIIIILYHWEENKYNGNHYALIDSVKNNKYNIVNYSFDIKEKWIIRRELKTMLLKYDSLVGQCPKIWYAVPNM